MNGGSGAAADEVARPAERISQDRSIGANIERASHFVSVVAQTAAIIVIIGGQKHRMS